MPQTGCTVFACPHRCVVHIGRACTCQFVLHTCDWMQPQCSLAHALPCAGHTQPASVSLKQRFQTRLDDRADGNWIDF